MYIFARLQPNKERTPMKRSLFPKMEDASSFSIDQLTNLLSKKLPVTCTELDLDPNGPLELLLAVINFCHQHEITLRINQHDDLSSAINVLTFNDCPTCGARFSSCFHLRCPHCGGWGYAPHYE